MATTGADAVFVDTNILVYAHQSYSPFHAAATDALQRLAAAGNPLYLSRQILREYLASMTRTALVTSAADMAALISDVVSFEKQFIIAEDSAQVTQQLLSLLSNIICAGKQIHDANIVATMLTAGVSTLLTHNVSDFQRFASVITIMSLVP